MKKIIKGILYSVVVLYILVCVLLYFFQEKLIFAPDKLTADYKFNFLVKFDELNIKTVDGELLNGLLFKSDSSKGLIFYLHGNGGCIGTWGEIAKTYTNLNYDLFELDYRGYGKSTGKISSQEQMFSDIQTAYDSLKCRYSEDKIIVLGYSLGTGLAAKLASTNYPKHLILQAPYYNIKYMMQKDFPIIPTFILKYKFETDTYIRRCKMPITIFHGDADKLIPYDCSIQLIKLTKPTDELITLKGRGHNGMSDNPEYVRELSRVLNFENQIEEDGYVDMDQKIGLDSIVSLSYNRAEKYSFDKFTVKIKVTSAEGDSTNGHIHITKSEKKLKEIDLKGSQSLFSFDLNSNYVVECSKAGYMSKVVRIDTHVPQGREVEEFANFTMEVELHKLTASNKGKTAILAGGIIYNENVQDFDVEK